VTADSLTGDLRADAGVLVLTAVIGALGGLAQGAVAQDPADTSAWWKRVVVGVVAAIGTLWALVPATAVALVGQSLLAGYFGRAVLAVLQTRVTAALAADQKARAVAVANDAIALVARTSPIAHDDLKAMAPASAVSHELAALRARLADLQPR
jgi:hypothetical protein